MPRHLFSNLITAAEEEYIGGGAFGDVYKIVKNGKNFAVKKMRNANQDALKEIELLKMVDHRFIIKYHSCFFENPICIVMEYADQAEISQTKTETFIYVVETETC